MGQATTMNAMLMCTFGTGPTTLEVLPKSRVLIGGVPVADISTEVPILNIPPFPTCISPLPSPIPPVKPCIPALAGPWIPTSPTILVGGMPILDNMSKAICSRGGVITILLPGQFNTIVG